MLRDEGPLTPIAGCTDVYVNLQFGTATRDSASSISGRSTELRGISRRRADAAHRRARRPTPRSSTRRSCAGACRCWSRRRARSAAGRFRIAARSAATSPTPRRRATRCRCSPPPMRWSCSSAPSGERRVPFNAFYTGYRASVRRADELIAAIEIPRVEGAQWWRKVGTRRAQAISKVMMAGVRGPAVRVALGSVAPTVIRAAQNRTRARIRDIAGRGAAGARRGNRPDRRHPVDGGLSPPGQRQSAGAILEGNERRRAAAATCAEQRCNLH